jgi:hypothetical protein
MCGKFTFLRWLLYWLIGGCPTLLPESACSIVVEAVDLMTRARSRVPAIEI